MADATSVAEQRVIAVAGAAAIDMTLRRPPLDWIGSPSKDHYTPEMFHKLEDPPELGLGGNGAAAAYVLGVLGVRVLLSGPIGEDAAGWLVRDWLKKANVECVGAPASSTMFSLLLVDIDSRRLAVLVHPSPRIDWISSAGTEGATWLLLAAHSQVAADELDEVGEALRLFQSRGGITVLDPGVGWMRTNPAEQMTGVWANVDLLIGTLDELQFWTGVDQPEQIAKRARRQGARRVVIKMGEDGAAYMDEDENFDHQPACRVARSDVSVGTGDAFNGALLARLVGGESLASAVAFAQTVAAKVVEIGHGVIGWERTVRA